MIQRLYRSLQRLLGGLGLPVYAEGQVPEEAVYPYLTWSVNTAAGGGQGRGTVVCWYRRDYAGCIHLLDRLAALLP